MSYEAIIFNDLGVSRNPTPSLSLWPSLCHDIAQLATQIVSNTIRYWKQHKTNARREGGVAFLPHPQCGGTACSLPCPADALSWAVGRARPESPREKS